MKLSSYQQNCLVLANLMKQVNISNIEELSDASGVSELQIRRLQYGLVYKISVETLVKLAAALQISIEQMLDKFTRPLESSLEETTELTPQKSVQFWQQEYQQLKLEMAQQAETLTSEFQNSSIQAIESWLIQWPTAIAAIVKNPELPAAKLIPLVKPVEHLIEQWGIETISEVGAELHYNPQWQELMSGFAEPGTLVKVRYVGYKQGDRILYKAKVSPVNI